MDYRNELNIRCVLAWQSCTKWKECSEVCVQEYMVVYGKYCIRNREPTCRDYSLIHHFGPSGCNLSGPTYAAYWSKVKACCDNKGGC